MTRSRHINAPRKPWSSADLRKLARLYPDTPTARIAEALGRKVASVYQQANVMGLRKSAAYLASPAAGRTTGRQGIGTRFTPGHASWNKGTKGTTGLHPNCRPTQFKPGERQGVAVKLYKPVGTERVSKDGYREVKVNDGMPLQARWRAVHLVKWEAINGRIPKGHALVFRDGNKANVEPENMELVTRAELMLRNTLHRYPQPIPQLIQLRGALNRKINRKDRDEKQDGRPA